jgi:glycerol-3-phosphate dehydrogenase subunit B
MKSDVVVIGAELESLVAALRLSAEGAKTRLLMPGAGSLHYASGTLSVLRTDPLVKDHSPFNAMNELDRRHPYRILGPADVESAIDWFLEWIEQRGSAWFCDRCNVETVTMAGTSLPAFAFPRSLASYGRLCGGDIAIVALEEHLDFAPDLCASGLARTGVNATILRLPSPAVGDSVRVARAFDSCDHSYFEDVRKRLPAEIEVAMFPALLGLDRADSVLDLAAEILDVTVLEIATLPPSVFGLRLYQLLLNALTEAGIDIHPHVRDLHGRTKNGSCELLRDGNGVEYRAEKYIVAGGGVLMGGLNIDSRGEVHEPILDLDVYQTNSLGIDEPGSMIDALHRTGAQTDDRLRPSVGGCTLGNVHVAGALLAHWNPVEELSNEGVAIATGKAAADFAIEDMRI